MRVVTCSQLGSGHGVQRAARKPGQTLSFRGSYRQVSDWAVTDGSAKSRRKGLGSRNTLSWHVLHAVSEPS